MLSPNLNPDAFNQMFICRRVLVIRKIVLLLLFSVTGFVYEGHFLIRFSILTAVVGVDGTVIIRCLDWP